MHLMLHNARKFYKYDTRFFYSETMLVTAAAGGTGLAAVDLGANVFGAKVIGAAGSSEKTAIAQSKGASHVINYRQQDLRKEVITENVKNWHHFLQYSVSGLYFTIDVHGISKKKE